MATKREWELNPNTDLTDNAPEIVSEYMTSWEFLDAIDPELHENDNDEQTVAEQFAAIQQIKRLLRKVVKPEALPHLYKKCPNVNDAMEYIAGKLKANTTSPEAN